MLYKSLITSLSIYLLCINICFAQIDWEKTYPFFDGVFTEYVDKDDMEAALYVYSLLLRSEYLGLPDKYRNRVCNKVFDEIDARKIEEIPRSLYSCGKDKLMLWAKKNEDLGYVRAKVFGCAKPKYPLWASLRKLSGKVVIRYKVDAENNLIEYRIASSDRRVFNGISKRSFKSCQFKSATLFDKPVESKWREFTYEYSLF